MITLIVTLILAGASVAAGFTIMWVLTNKYPPSEDSGESDWTENAAQERTWEKRMKDLNKWR